MGRRRSIVQALYEISEVKVVSPGRYACPLGIKGVTTLFQVIPGGDHHDRFAQESCLTNRFEPSCGRESPAGGEKLQEFPVVEAMVGEVFPG